MKLFGGERSLAPPPPSVRHCLVLFILLSIHPLAQSSSLPLFLFPSFPLSLSPSLFLRVILFPAFLDNNESEKQAKILGLNKTIFIVVVVAAVLLIILVSSVICRQIKRGKTQRNARITPKEGEDGMGTQPKGLLFQPSKKETDDKVPPSQEIGLVTFENKEGI